MFQEWFLEYRLINSWHLAACERKREDLSERVCFWHFLTLPDCNICRMCNFNALFCKGGEKLGSEIKSSLSSTITLRSCDMLRPRCGIFRPFSAQCLSRSFKSWTVCWLSDVRTQSSQDLCCQKQPSTLLPRKAIDSIPRQSFRLAVTVSCDDSPMSCDPHTFLGWRSRSLCQNPGSRIQFPQNFELEVGFGGQDKMHQELTPLLAAGLCYL